MMHSSPRKYSLLRRGILIFWCGVILYITVFSRTPSLLRSVQLQPLGTLWTALSGNSQIGLQFAANILLFVPLGYLLQRFRPAGLTALLLSLLVELVQYRWFLGIASVDDLITNTLGGLLGALLYQALCRMPHFSRIAAVLPCIFLAGGLLSCWIWQPMVAENYEESFAFQIEQVSGVSMTGYCFLYNRSAAEARYQLLLKNDEGTIPLDARTGLSRTDVAAYYADGQDYTASGFQAVLPDDLDGVFEIRLLWNGLKEAPTGFWLVDGTLCRVPTADVSQESGTLLAENAFCSLYQKDDCLYWVLNAPASGRIFYHIYTNQPDYLPEARQAYGFDNLDFSFGSYALESADGRPAACRELPSGYAIAYIQTGMFNSDGVIWSERFRPVIEFSAGSDDS